MSEKVVHKQRMQIGCGCIVFVLRNWGRLDDFVCTIIVDVATCSDGVQSDAEESVLSNDVMWLCVLLMELEESLEAWVVKDLKVPF